MVAAEIKQKGIRRWECQRIITAMEKLPEAVTELDEVMWSSLVAYITVYSKDNLRFTQPCGTAISV